MRGSNAKRRSQPKPARRASAASCRIVFNRLVSYFRDVTVLSFPRSFAGPLVLCLLGCSEGPSTHSLEFSLRYAGKEVGCGDVLKGVGLSKSTVELRDARIYLHDIVLSFADGLEEPLFLEESEWQREGAVLLDFADDTGLCATGSPETNHHVIGTTARGGEVVGVRFKLGLPYELNHLDAARSPAPLNAPGMAWSWTGGYKYARIDAKTSGNENWYIHLGATGCTGSPAVGISCAYNNLSTIDVALSGTSSTIEIDLGRLYAESDLDKSIDFTNDFVNGCMAFGGDPECPAIFSALGLTFESNDSTDQIVFLGADR